MVDYEADAQALREAIKGSGTDEDTIINLTASRSNSERLEIRKTYKASFGTDLIDDLNDDLGGNFGKVVVSMYLSPVEYDVSELRKAMEGAGSEEGTLSEIIGSRTNTRLKQILSLYKLKYDEPVKSGRSNAINHDRIRQPPTPRLTLHFTSSATQRSEAV